MRKIENSKTVFKKVDDEWFLCLPLIDLDEKGKQEKTAVILGRIRECLFKMPVTLSEESSENDSNYQIVSSYNYGDETVVVMVIYYSVHDFIRIKIPFRKVPESQKQVLYEMINLLNERFAAWHFFISPDTCEVTLEAGIYISRFLNGREFFLLLRQMIENGFLYFPVIEYQIFSGRAAITILEEYDNDIKILLEINKATI